MPETPASRKRSRVDQDRPAYPRKRAVQACHTCRQKRIKCDNEKPSCGSCAGLGIQCIYREHDKSTFDPASNLILQRLDTLEELIRATNSPAVSTPDLIYHQVTHESPALERTESSTLYHINVETILGWPVFQCHNFSERQGLKALLQSDSHPGPSPLSASLDFENCGAKDLLQNFIQHVHIYNPVLETGKIEQYMRDALFNGLGWDSKSCLLLLIYALGNISGPRQTPIPDSSLQDRETVQFQKAEAYFQAAQKRMGMLLCKSSEIEAQCFFLAGVYLMATLRPFSAWPMFVQALVSCEGFHNPQLQGEIHDDKGNVLQQSLYWTCFKSELELRLELGIGKHSVLDLTYPELFPSPPENLESQGAAEWYFYLAEIALRRIGNRALDLIYNRKPCGKSVEVETILNFEEQANGLLDSLPVPLKLDTPTGETSPQDAGHAPLRFILKGHLLDCYEMIYWPFVVDAIWGTLPADPELQSFARKGLKVCVERIQKNESGFLYRHHGTWLMLRSCTRSALVLCGAALRNLKALLPSGWKFAVENVICLLRYWKDEAKDVADRLEILEVLLRRIEDEEDLAGNTFTISPN